MDIYSIYKVTNLINLKGYVGFTGNKNPLTRLTQHKSSAKCGKSFYLYKAFRKYGMRNFTFEVIYQSKDKKHTLDVMEEYFIRLFNTHCKDGWGYNMNYGGRGGNIPCKETRLKISRHRKGKIGPWLINLKCPKIGLQNGRADKNIYSFIHNDGRQFNGARQELVTLYPEENLDSRKLKLMINKIKWRSNHKGWHLNESNLDNNTETTSHAFI